MPRNFGRGVSDVRDQSPSGASQPFSGKFDFRDSSGPLFSMYLKIGEEEDNKIAQRWQGDAKGILYFAGLFSAAVATLLSVTVLDLKSSSQDTSAFHLKNIQQLLADPNISRDSIPSQPRPFSPPIYSIWVNALLFLSLVISLTCALLATLLQQWARRYLSFTQQPGYSPHKRARIRAFFSDGVDKFRVSWVVEALPALLHLSLSLFLAGLLVWLFNINGPLFYAVVWMVAFSTIAYMWITFLPIFQPKSPYSAPLSSTIWSIYTGIAYVVFRVLVSEVFHTGHRFHDLKKYYNKRLSDGLEKTAEKTAWKMASEIDVRILESTLDALGEDGARAGFFEVIPGFFDSDQVKVEASEEHLHDFRIKFSRELNRFLDRTFSSNFVTESTRSVQLIICLNAAQVVLGPDGVSQVLIDILSGRWKELLQSVEMAHSLRRWDKSTDDEFTHYVRRIVTHVIAGVRERDDRWISLTKAEFGVPDQVLRENIDHGDSLLLSLLIHITRQAFRSGAWTPFILASITQFDIRNTLPELQHEFCTLWNEIVQEAWRGRPDCINILREIRHAYIGLHQGTDAAPTAFSAHTYHFDPVLAQPRSYHACNVPSHRPDWTPQGFATNHLAVPTPTRAAFGSSAASTTQVGGSPSPSPHLTPIEIQRIPGNTDIVIISPNANIIHATPQQAEEVNILPRFHSSADFAIKHSHHTPPHTHTFISSTPSPVNVTQRVLPVTSHSVPESIGTIKAYEGSRDLHPPTSVGLFHRTFQSTQSVASANHVRPEGTRTDQYGSGTGETSQAFVVASRPCLYLDPLPTVVEPWTSSIPPHSFSATNQDGVLDVSQSHALAATSPRLPENNQRRDMAVSCAASDASETSYTANHISRPIPSSGVTLERGEEIAIVPVPAPVASVYDTQSSPILMPADDSGLTAAEHPSFTDHVAQPIVSPPISLSMARSNIYPQSSDIDTPITPSSGVFLAHSGTSELGRPIPPISLKISSDPSQSELPALNLVADTSLPGD